MMELTKKEKNRIKYLHALYPVRFNGKEWNRSQCDYLFTQFYNDRNALQGDCSVYVSDGLYIQPDGTTIEE